MTEVTGPLGSKLFCVSQRPKREKLHLYAFTVHVFAASAKEAVTLAKQTCSAFVNGDPEYNKVRATPVKLGVMERY